jgi:alpha,alpha-trehalose phosphorylase
MEIGNHTADGFHINSVTGPDEYTCLVNDNYYTNRMAGVNLESAVQTYDFMKTGHPEILERLGVSLQLESGERDDWERAALKMVIPYDAAADMNPQDESFFRKPVWDIVRTPPNRFPLLLHYHHMTLSRFQVCKQADTVLAYVLLDPCRADSTSRNSFAYYEKLTTHDSSLSYGAFAIMACRLGELEKAYSYLLKTAVLDLQDTHGNTRDGIHAAGMGGSWLALVWGFGGFRPKGAVPAFEPRLPAKWTSLRFCITWRGSTFEIVIRRDRISLSLVDGPALAAEVYGTPVLLAEGRTPSVPYQEAPC